jgi:hypothetical protein
MQQILEKMVEIKHLVIKGKPDLKYSIRALYSENRHFLGEFNKKNFGIFLGSNCKGSLLDCSGDEDLIQRRAGKVPGGR